MDPKLVADFYQYYLSKHTHPKNRLMHFIGQWATIVYVLAVLSMQAWWFLLAAPLVVYPFAWTGHYVFEKNKPAALTSPQHLLRSKIADWIMFWDIINLRLTIY